MQFFVYFLYFWKKKKQKINNWIESKILPIIGDQCYFNTFLFHSWSLSSLNTIPIFALISAGAEAAGCPSVSLGLQPLEGIWGHCEPLCCPAGSAAHCSLPAFTGFPVSGYHVLCLFSLLFVCVHPIGLVRRPPTRLAEERMALSLLQWGGKWVVGVASPGWLTCIITTQGIFAIWPSLIANAARTCVFGRVF